jgi:hypothetical protein
MTEQTGQLSFQVLFDVAISALGLVGAWILSTIWTEIKQARSDHSELIAKLPETYARRDDVAAAIDRLETAINQGLARIFDKLDAKADKQN